MLINEIRPCSHLTQYVRLYRIIDFHFSKDVIIPPKMYSPRPEQCLQFYPRDTETVIYPDSNMAVSNKRVTVTGQHTVLSQRHVGNHFLSLQVVFQPGALYRLSGISMQEIANHYLDAGDIFGSQVHEINERLYHAPSYEAMICILEFFLTQLACGSEKEKHSVDNAGMQMLLQEENFKLDRFIKESCLCHRQFDRKFKERTGIAPKQFLQITRFDKAFRMKNRLPELDWLSIALHCGYYDYQHLAKDYLAFTGYTPQQFFLIDSQAPERAFGDAET